MRVACRAGRHFGPRWRYGSVLDVADGVRSQCLHPLGAVLDLEVEVQQRPDRQRLAAEVPGLRVLCVQDDVAD